jgi:hypothetical protein
VVLFFERVSKFRFRFILVILCKVNCASEVFTASLIRAMSYDGGTSESTIFMLLYLVVYVSHSRDVSRMECRYLRIVLRTVFELKRQSKLCED